MTWFSSTLVLSTTCKLYLRLQIIDGLPSLPSNHVHGCESILPPSYWSDHQIRARLLSCGPLSIPQNQLNKKILEIWSIINIRIIQKHSQHVLVIHSILPILNWFSLNNFRLGHPIISFICHVSKATTLFITTFHFFFFLLNSYTKNLRSTLDRKWENDFFFSQNPTHPICHHPYSHSDLSSPTHSRPGTSSTTAFDIFSKLKHKNLI